LEGLWQDGLWMNMFNTLTLNLDGKPENMMIKTLIKTFHFNLFNRVRVRGNFLPLLKREKQNPKGYFLAGMWDDKYALIEFKNDWLWSIKKFKTLEELDKKLRSDKLG
jgi:hypothetical protein